jgi:putative ABC transport system ATP-binding protein
MSEPIIKVEDLDVVFDKGTPKETYALKNINIEINKGEYVIIFGPSGCGKSTLLYHIAGMDKRVGQGGKISIGGTDILKLDDQDILQIRKKKIGMIFQAYNLINTINVINNVCLPFFLRGQNNKEIIKKGEKALESLDVLNQRNKYPTSLSGGQQQRVAIARALITDPEIIFADEPVGNLDFKSAYDVLTILSDLNLKEKKTIVFVTHDMNYLPFADKIIYLWDGAISKIEVNRRKLTPSDKFGDREKAKISDFTRRLAGSIVSFILHPDEKEILANRVEHKLIQFLTHEVLWDELIDFFKSPIKLGGLGFGYDRVKKMEESLKKMRMQNNLLFFKYFNKIDKNDIVDILCSEVDCEFNLYQKGRLAEILEFRIADIVGESSILKFLISSEEEKGLNLSHEKAEVLNEKINIFIDLLHSVKAAQKGEKDKEDKKTALGEPRQGREDKK